MAVLYADFVAAFPEFGGLSAFKEPQIDFWLGQADSTLSVNQFGTSLTLASMLFAAHNLALSARSAVGATGAVSGPVASKSVDALSISYDNSIGSIDGAGIYNTTSYGQRFYKLLQGIVAGGAYVPSPQAIFGVCGRYSGYGYR